jgi:hypothetical protein
MAQVQITDVVVPAEFTAYQVENSMVSTALFQSGVVLPQWRDAGSVTGWGAAVHRSILVGHSRHRLDRSQRSPARRADRIPPQKKANPAECACSSMLRISMAAHLSSELQSLLTE